MGKPRPLLDRALFIFANCKMVVKLFIGGFPLEMDEMALAQLISPYGRIDTMKIVRDKKTRICKGYAFVEMASEDDAVVVMAALDGEQLGGRLLSVKLTDAPPPEPAPTARYEKVVRLGEPIKKKRPRRQI
ncbi:MAG: recognition motif protein [Mucilaginibacter sp.]|nr:recognition motif protein [Mucilaginibacter sp.]